MSEIAIYIPALALFTSACLILLYTGFTPETSFSAFVRLGVTFLVLGAVAVSAAAAAYAAEQELVQEDARRCPTTKTCEPAKTDREKVAAQDAGEYRTVIRQALMVFVCLVFAVAIYRTATDIRGTVLRKDRWHASPMVWILSITCGAFNAFWGVFLWEVVAVDLGDFERTFNVLTAVVALQLLFVGVAAAVAAKLLEWPGLHTESTSSVADLEGRAKRAELVITAWPTQEFVRVPAVQVPDGLLLSRPDASAVARLQRWASRNGHEANPELASNRLRANWPIDLEPKLARVSPGIGTWFASTLTRPRLRRSSHSLAARTGFALTSLEELRAAGLSVEFRRIH